jgi:hypothetical protein
LYYALNFGCGGFCVGALGGDKLVALAQGAFLGYGEQVYITEVFELTGEDVSLAFEFPLRFGEFGEGLVRCVGDL